VPMRSRAIDLTAFVALNFFFFFWRAMRWLLLPQILCTMQ
jgi:hypothetical protein